MFLASVLGSSIKEGIETSRVVRSYARSEGGMDEAER